MEERKLNLNSILGMDLRDFNTDQQYAKEIINLVKDKDGWRLRDCSLNVLSGLADDEVVKTIIYIDGKAYVQIDQTINVYSVVNDVFTTLLEKYTFDFDFKFYETNYKNVFFIIDTTNHINYVMELTERVYCAIDNTLDLTTSTELTINEFDANTSDFTWGSLARYNGYTSNTGISGGAATLTSSGTTVTISGGTTEHLAVGYTITANSVTKTITSITSSTVFVVDASPSWSGHTYTWSKTMLSKAYSNSVNRYLVNYTTENNLQSLAMFRQFNNADNAERIIVLTGEKYTSVTPQTIMRIYPVGSNLNNETYSQLLTVSATDIFTANHRIKYGDIDSLGITNSIGDITYGASFSTGINTMAFYKNRLYALGDSNTAFYYNNSTNLWVSDNTNISSNILCSLIYQNVLWCSGSGNKAYYYNDASGGWTVAASGGGALAATINVLIEFNELLWALGVAKSYIWNGTGWTSVGTLTNITVLCACVYKGELFIGGTNTSTNLAVIYKWDGVSAWTSVSYSSGDSLQRIQRLYVWNNELFVIGNIW